ncbi:unnamed protein product [Brassica oleracea var. botrytis]|uniref:Uncharacterized protein n=1 Tax=Brassica oleracea TaxID=3712 RepID=A0A3P6GA98_BRAOL|nr:unnamed protein product [Brassica oleracea]
MRRSTNVTVSPSIIIDYVFCPRMQHPHNQSSCKSIQKSTN